MRRLSYAFLVNLKIQCHLNFSSPGTYFRCNNGVLKFMRKSQLAWMLVENVKTRGGDVGCEWRKTKPSESDGNWGVSHGQLKLVSLSLCEPKQGSTKITVLAAYHLQRILTLKFSSYIYEDSVATFTPFSSEFWWGCTVGCGLHCRQG